MHRPTGTSGGRDSCKHARAYGPTAIWMTVVDGAHDARPSVWVSVVYIFQQQLARDGVHGLSFNNFILGDFCQNTRYAYKAGAVSFTLQLLLTGAKVVAS